ncbi:MAG TPA: hypothetical protein VLY21_00800 [Nitrososphaerales archaeon]|nr:hypothetical protein [Nitrososphaerales archaeon]
MADLIIFVWRNREGTGEPEVEVKIPAAMAKWVPRLMRFVPRSARDQYWGQDVDFEGMLSDLDKLVNEALASGRSELMSVKTKDSFVKVTVQP